MVKAEETVEKPSKDGSIVPVVKEEESPEVDLARPFGGELSENSFQRGDMLYVKFGQICASRS